jgi:tungstate transport system substrate-binding protein
MRLWSNILVILACTVLNCSKSTQSKTPVILATTTSTYDSGLLDSIVPDFKKKTGLTVKTVAVGTGQALELGRRGEADVLLVHAPKVEEAFVAKGHGKNRRPVMHNDFVLVGPKDDPAKIRGMKNAALALVAITKAGVTWASRGDLSGTHHKEKELWEAAGIQPTGSWFMETGQGMGATLRLADEKRAYTISDRGTFLSVDNISLEVLVEGDERLFNPYHVIEVVHTNANKEGGKILAAFFVEPDTQKKIGAFKSKGFNLFKPDALPGEQK